MHQIKLNAALGVSRATTYISFPPIFLQDMAGNAIVDASPSNAIRVNTYVPDTPPPHVVEAHVNMSTGEIRFVMDEPIDASSIEIAEVQVVSVDGTAQLDISGTAALVPDSLSLQFSVTLSQAAYDNVLSSAVLGLSANTVCCLVLV